MDATLQIPLTPEQEAAKKEQARVDLKNWFLKSAELKQIKADEAELRAKVVTYYFPNGLKEGTNKAELPDGWKLDVKGTINRKVEADMIADVTQIMKEKFEMDAGELLKWKPEIDLPGYRQLVKNIAEASGDEAKDRARKILATFESLLTITPGTPQVELVAPKKPKAPVTVV